MAAGREDVFLPVDCMQYGLQSHQTLTPSSVCGSLAPGTFRASLPATPAAAGVCGALRYSHLPAQQSGQSGQFGSGAVLPNSVPPWRRQASAAVKPQCVAAHQAVGLGHLGPDTLDVNLQAVPACSSSSPAQVLPHQAALVGRWCYEGGEYEISNRNGQLFFSESGVEGLLMEGPEWLEGNLKTGHVRIKLHDASGIRAVSNFKAKGEYSWLPDTFATKASLLGRWRYEGGEYEISNRNGHLFFFERGIEGLLVQGPEWLEGDLHTGRMRIKLQDASGVRAVSSFKPKDEESWLPETFATKAVPACASSSPAEVPSGFEDLDEDAMEQAISRLHKREAAQSSDEMRPHLAPSPANVRSCTLPQQTTAPVCERLPLQQQVLPGDHGFPSTAQERSSAQATLHASNMMVNLPGRTNTPSASPPGSNVSWDCMNLKYQIEICPRPWNYLLFTVRCSTKLPAQLCKELSAWPGAQDRGDGQAVSYLARGYDEIVQRLQELVHRTKSELSLPPEWVRSVAGFGLENGAPPLGLPSPDAKQRVLQYLSTFPPYLQERSPVLPYQVDGVTFGLHRGGRVLIGDEMGLGKTVQALLLTGLYEHEWPLLVVAPSSLRFVWRDQAAQWLPHFVGEDGGRVHVIKNGKDRPPGSARIVVGTYDLLRRHDHLRTRFDGRGYLVVIVDESQNIKDAGSQRAKAVVGLCKAARRAILLSGTPALNRAVELYPQLEALLPAEMPSFRDFAERYSNKERQCFGRKVVEKWSGVKRAEELNMLLSCSVMVRRLKKDVLDQLPTKRRMRVPLDSERMNEEMLKEVQSQMRQMRSCEDALDQPGAQPLMPDLFRLTAEAKLDAVLDYVDHLLTQGTKFLLFAHHHVMLDALERKLNSLNVPLVRIDGKVAPALRNERAKRFQEDEATRVAVLSITAAGQGLTLTAASTVVFAELYWVPGQMQQAEDRAHRIGQTNFVMVHYLIARDTIDEVVYRSLEKKSKDTSQILDGRQRGLAAEETVGIPQSLAKRPRTA